MEPKKGALNTFNQLRFDSAEMTEKHSTSCIVQSADQYWTTAVSCTPQLPLEG